MKTKWLTPGAVIGTCGLIVSIATAWGVVSGTFKSISDSEVFPASKGYVRDYNKKPTPHQLDTQIEIAEGKRERAEDSLWFAEIELKKRTAAGDEDGQRDASKRIRTQKSTIEKLDDQIKFLKAEKAK